MRSRGVGRGSDPRGSRYYAPSMMHSSAVNLPMSQIDLVNAATAADYTAGRALIEEYAAALGVDLCFQNFSTEIADLPTCYGPPGGCLLLAKIGGQHVGCVAIRPHAGTICEMKRLYVRPGQRGAHVGRRLVEAAIEQATRLGYTRIVLDTLPGMIEAQRLYEMFGFKEIEGYYPNPLPGVRYLALEIGGSVRP
jgi:ribosomal protein S18 acetylase RimI-like enzyme